MRRFNRNTMVVATGLVGTVIFAPLVLAVEEHHLMPAEVAEKTIQIRPSLAKCLDGGRRHRHRPKDKTKPVAAVMQLGRTAVNGINVHRNVFRLQHSFTSAIGRLDGASD
jgi:hypothetical protein